MHTNLKWIERPRKTKYNLNYLLIVSLLSISTLAGINHIVLAQPITEDVDSNVSPINIYRDTYSPNSQVNIRIYAPDFNSNPYAIDTIGDDLGGKITIATRESSIPYRLVETGSDTGIFEGYVILGGTTSTCSPICGPTDGFLAASGDDAITVSFTYGVGKTMVSSMNLGISQEKTNHSPIPEFSAFSGLTILISIVGSIILSNRFVKKQPSRLN